MDTGTGFLRRAAVWTFALLLSLPVLGGGPALGQPAAAAPTVCKIGVDVEDMYELDMARDTFGALLWVWSLCPSRELSPLEAMAFPTGSPGLSLGPIDTVDFDDGSRYSTRRVQGTFRFDWDMNHYPFDRHRVVIPIDDTRYGAAVLTFEPDAGESFLSPDIRDRLYEWRISELELAASVMEEDSNYGLPGTVGARYARLEAAVTVERANFVTFLKLTSGVFAGVFIAFMTFFHDSNDKGGFGSRLGLLVGVLFAVLINMRTADSTIGDTGHLTLVTEIHLATLILVVALALIALRDRRRNERGVELPHPDWTMFAATAGVYGIVMAWLIAAAHAH